MVTVVKTGHWILSWCDFRAGRPAGWGRGSEWQQWPQPEEPALGLAWAPGSASAHRACSPGFLQEESWAEVTELIKNTGPSCGAVSMTLGLYSRPRKGAFCAHSRNRHFTQLTDGCLLLLTSGTEVGAQKSRLFLPWDSGTLRSSTNHSLFARDWTKHNAIQIEKKHLWAGTKHSYRNRNSAAWLGLPVSDARSGFPHAAQAHATLRAAHATLCQCYDVLILFTWVEF